MGVKKKRIISVRLKERVIRSFNQIKFYKDVPYSQVREGGRNDEMGCDVTRWGRDQMSGIMALITARYVRVHVIPEQFVDDC